MEFDANKIKIGIIGLGYVGLPLAIEFAKKFSVAGYDKNTKRVNELKKREDKTNEATTEQLATLTNIKLTNSVSDIKECNIFIVTVPTPVDEFKKPDFTSLMSASHSVGGVLKRGDLVIFESTVYPGATREICLPILEKTSQLSLNKDFYLGYSPERINPGDKNRRLGDITKVVSGSCETSSNFINKLYSSIIPAGTFQASSIEVAEAAKIIENTQRDVNIGLINEFSLIFGRLNINSQEVLEAAATKWNFLNFRPGLVGGHCIGVDPYYLAHKAEEVGYRPEIILTARRLNDSMGSIVAVQLVQKMIQKGSKLHEAAVLVMGFTFKENCPDVRNTGVMGLIDELRKFDIETDVFDPHCHPDDVMTNFGIRLTSTLKENTYDGVVVAVGHDEFKYMGLNEIRKMGKEGAIIFDLKHLFSTKDVDMQL